MSTTARFAVVANHITFFDRRWIDFSSLTFLPSVFGDDAFNVELRRDGLAIFSDKYVNLPTYGYFCVAFGQSPEHNGVVWTVRTIQAILSDVGGYQAILLSLCALLLANY